MDPLTGPFFAAVALLGAAGGAKLARPGAARAALASVRLPATDGAVRVLGAAEVGVAILALGLGGAPAALAVGAWYAAFAAFVTFVLSRGGTLRSCGCFGTPDTPPTRLHIGVNLAFAGTAALVARGGAPSLPAALSGQPLGGLPLLAAVVVCAWLAYLTLTVLPTVGTLVARRAR